MYAWRQLVLYESTWTVRSRLSQNVELTLAASARVFCCQCESKRRKGVRRQLVLQQSTPAVHSSSLTLRVWNLRGVASTYVCLPSVQMKA